MIAFRSKITISLLGYYFLNPNVPHHINELANLLEVDLGNLFRKLKELESEGILISETRGNQKYFSLNKNYPLLKEIKKIYEAKYGIAELLKGKLAKLKGLQEGYIFGSYVKNTLQQESDIDILLIGTHKSIEAKRLILPLQKIIQREINIIDLAPQEFKKRQKNNDELLKNIFSSKIIKFF